MSEKTPISILQEYCVQQKAAPPLYNISNMGSKGFICVVHAFDIEAEAKARSKSEAKHASCTNILCRFN